MEKNKNVKKSVENTENMGEVLNTAERWIEDNSSLLVWCVLGILVVVLGGLSVYHYVIKPKSLEANNENAKAVVYFMQGDFQKALNGDEEDCLGFEEIANSYRFYQPGKLAALYAGICYYQLEDYENAAKYVKRFSGKDMNIHPLACQMLGDIYVELEDYDSAIKAYKKAVKSGNEVVAPRSLKKAGIVYLEMGKKEAAQKVFEAIKNDYSQSEEAQDIDKYIVLAAN